MELAQDILPDRPPAGSARRAPGPDAPAVGGRLVRHRTGRPAPSAPARRRLVPPRRRRRLGPTLLAVAGGLLMWLAFPPHDLVPLAPVGVAFLTLALHGRVPGLRTAPGTVRATARTGAWLGFLGGAAFFLPVLTGIVKIGPDAWVLLSLVEAAYLAPMGAGIALAARLPGWPVWAAGLWVAQEAARGRVPFGGFPWARLAFSQTSTPLTPYASVAGAPLVTFLTALTGGLLAYAALAALRTRTRTRVGGEAATGTAAGTDGEATIEPSDETTTETAGGGPRSRGPSRVLIAAASVAVPLALIAAIVGGGALIPTPADGRPVTVAVVQGNVPRLGLDFQGQRRAVLDNHVEATRELARRVRAGEAARPELVVWPENSSDLDPYREPDAYAAIDGAVKDIGVPVLVGALTATPDQEKVENRGIVWDPETGPGDYYVKRHPVPFGEYVPFRDILTKFIDRFGQIPRDFVHGTRSGVMRLGPVTVGDVICFEVAYDQEVRDVAAGQLLVVQTNNATYGHTSLPPQQIAMSRLRAVEHGRTILVAATSGISAIVAPDGRMIDRSGEFVRDLQVATVPARTSTTLSDRMGAAPEWAMAALGVAAACAAAGAMVRSTRTARAARGPDGAAVDSNDEEK
ncbi:apolipoprotein N-acyltransferase [Actinomadura sp. CNU-125]|uniref:apolipoprotein N-acyltransferase n=1 Tax=Actinomadura sp. CNU-125 TaxID=1904961 RepID=UPI00095D017D|nr:apolipoprotein N-acyltransferase [Actinomadura sp. CNU-125]OLT28677.1 apolipoprotein N-acyltransferase [Actinomadura sp. CNU-125]